MKSQKPISVRSRKNKGRKLQNWVAEKISNILNIPWGKDELISSRAMGQSGIDVPLRGEALELFPFSIECSNSEKWAVHQKIKQARSNRKEGTDWLLFFKRNNEKPVVLLDAEVFFGIYEAYINWLYPEIKDENNSANS